MKMKSFDRWHLDELDQFIALDGGSIKIRFITEFEYVIRIYYDEVLTYSVSYQPHQQNQYGAPAPYGDWGQPTTPFSPHQTTQTGGNTTDRQPPYSSQSDNPRSNNGYQSNTITSSRFFSPPFFIQSDPIRSRRRRGL